MCGRPSSGKAVALPGLAVQAREARPGLPAALTWGCSRCPCPPGPPACPHRGVAWRCVSRPHQETEHFYLSGLPNSHFPAKFESEQCVISVEIARLFLHRCFCRRSQDSGWFCFSSLPRRVVIHWKCVFKRSSL